MENFHHAIRLCAVKKFNHQTEQLIRKDKGSCRSRTGFCARLTEQLIFTSLVAVVGSKWLTSVRQSEPNEISKISSTMHLAREIENHKHNLLFKWMRTAALKFFELNVQFVRLNCSTHDRKKVGTNWKQLRPRDGWHRSTRSLWIPFAVWIHYLFGLGAIINWNYFLVF